MLHEENHTRSKDFNEDLHVDLNLLFHFKIAYSLCFRFFWPLTLVTSWFSVLIGKKKDCLCDD